MILALTPHPDFPPSAARALAVEVVRDGAALALTYRLTGRIAGLAIPAPATPARTDGLWKATCFEAFLKPQDQVGYLELNFAPSGQWAAYRFDAYRAGMTDAEIAPPAIALTAAPDALELRVGLQLPGLGADVLLALTAVIEEASGAKSYWALVHPAGRPDFHDAAGFAASLI